MAINPYTLNSLYQKGIIDYVDPELCMGQPVISQYNMQNPYMNTAMSGNLYHNHGTQADSFSFNGNNVYGNETIGSKSSSFSNMFGLGGIGNKSNSTVNMFGTSGVGAKYNSDLLGTGDSSIGANYQGGGENAYGGFADVRNNINGGMAKVQSVYNSTPSILKGIAAVGIGLLGIKMLFRGKSSKAGKKGFLNKLMFWNKQTPAPEPEKKSFWSKLKFWKK